MILGLMFDEIHAAYIHTVVEISGGGGTVASLSMKKNRLTD